VIVRSVVTVSDSSRV